MLIGTKAVAIPSIDLPIDLGKSSYLNGLFCALVPLLVMIMFIVTLLFPKRAQRKHMQARCFFFFITLEINEVSQRFFLTAFSGFLNSSSEML